MFRTIALLVAFSVGIASLSAQEKGDGKFAKLAKLDKSKAFEKLDANSDGKLSKEEFKKMIEVMKEKLADKGAKAGKLADRIDSEKLFEKLDMNSDGSISKEEFEKSDILGGLRGKKKGESDEKSESEKKTEAEKKPESEKKPEGEKNG